MNLGVYAPFILWSYAVAILVIGALIAWVRLDHRALTRTLADLEARGVSRRSERAARKTVAP